MDSDTKLALTYTAEEFFLTAMAAGYAAGREPETVPGFPWAKLLAFEKGNFKLRDMWYSHPESNQSAGTTTIWHKDVPIWQMSYEGWYEKAVIPTLVACLKKAYESRRFCGGRGVRVPSDFRYHNHPRGAGFTTFLGVESIFNPSDGKICGVHNYRGGMLI